MMQAVVLALFIRTFVLQAYKIPSSSMENTLIPGDHIFVSKFLYGIEIPFTNVRILAWRSPRRGDVIVFQAPHELQKDYIKRCIGLPGQRVRIEDTQVYIDGVALEEPYAIFKNRPSSMPRDTFETDGPLPPDNYLMLGDNRDNSKDSRFWGTLPLSYVKGKALFLYWPLDRFRWFK